ncbi:amidase [Caldilinea sp.]|uniref:amidase n=1 Tax=Caldilinea sp. TaxID=2293560 RepID=UPI002B66A2BE|nr:amidase [Anaerolineales bacterium]HQY91009.1 amidase [Caldilinea sp.]
MVLTPAPLLETATALRSGELDLHTYLDTLCDHIEAVDAQVQAFLPEANRRDRLHVVADELLAAFPVPAERPALFGIAAGVKDIFHVQGFPTQAGAAVPAARLAGEEAISVQRLRTAGGLVAGKTVTTEFAYFEPGPTRNPHNLAHTPGGSSSGSAAAVAAGLCPLAFGTQTIGSVIRPAAFCGVAGFKPTRHRIPSPGLVYFSRTVDQVGLFTQDVAGMALAASALCDDWEEVTLSEDDIPVIGVPAGPYLQQASPEALAAFRRQLQRLEAEGYTIWHTPTLLDIEAINQWHRRLVFAEFAREHATLYAEFAPLYRPRTAAIIEQGKQVSDAELGDLRGACVLLRDQLEKQMQQAGIDLWVAPAAPGPAPAGLHSTGDPAMNLPWTTVGFPALTVPAGAVHGLPLGLQIVARYSDDELLLAWAADIETVLREEEE